MDAITLLRNDHKTVEALFKRFEKAGDRAFVEKREIVDRIIEELSIHASIEEQIFYPSTRAMVPSTEDIALESLEEHHIVKWVLSELVGLDPRHERFDAKVTVLIENVRHHMEEEQTDYFPKVGAALSRTQLADMGQALAAAKQTAPTRPHPNAPDSPPRNVVSSIAGVVDRLADNVSGIAQGGVSAGQDLIGRIVGTKKPAARPTGSTAARKKAESTRSTVDGAVDAAERTAQKVISSATAVGAAGASRVKSAAARPTKTAGRAAASTRSPGANARGAMTSAKSAGTSAKKAARRAVGAAR